MFPFEKDFINNKNLRENTPKAHPARPPAPHHSSIPRALIIAYHRVVYRRLYHRLQFVVVPGFVVQHVAGEGGHEVMGRHGCSSTRLVPGTVHLVHWSIHRFIHRSIGPFVTPPHSQTAARLNSSVSNLSPPIGYGTVQKHAYTSVEPYVD